MKKSLTLSFICDPGHGWLKVSFIHLKKYGESIISRISRYSYISYKTKSLYLEKDCDAVLFLHTLSKLGIEAKLKVSYSKKQSKIRNYDDFNYECFINHKF